MAVQLSHGGTDDSELLLRVPATAQDGPQSRRCSIIGQTDLGTGRPCQRRMTEPEESRLDEYRRPESGTRTKGSVSRTADPGGPGSEALPCHCPDRGLRSKQSQ